MTRPATQLNSSDLLNGPGLNMTENMPNTLVPLCAVFRVMDAGVAERMESNHRVDVIRAVICTPVYMMTFEVRLSTTIGEWRRRVAALTDALRSSQYVSRNSSGAVINVPLATRTLALVPCVYCLLPKHMVRSSLETMDSLIEHLLPKSFAPDKVEDYLLHRRAVTIHHYLVMTIVEPLAIEVVFSVLFNEQEKRASGQHVIGDLVVVVCPGVGIFRPLAIVLITSVRQEPIVVSVGIPLRGGNDNHSIFSIITVTYSHHTVPTKGGLDVSATVENLSNMFMPRHALLPAYLPLAVSYAMSCKRVKESR